MQPAELAKLPVLNPTRSPDGKRSSILIDVQGHVFQAVYMCLPTGELSDPTIHGTRADAMTPEQRIELEGAARLEAMRLKERHATELLAGMSVVSVDDLLSCVAQAPSDVSSGQEHRLRDWDPISGADEVPDPPRSHPVLCAVEWDGALAWLFWGTLDVEFDAADSELPQRIAELARRLGAKHVQLLSVWLERPELAAVF